MNTLLALLAWGQSGVILLLIGLVNGWRAALATGAFIGALGIAIYYVVRTPSNPDA